MRLDARTTERVLRERIDTAKGWPGEADLFDCTAEWLTVGTDEEKTGCKSSPIPSPPPEAAYIYHWPPAKGDPSTLFSRAIGLGSGGR